MGPELAVKLASLVSVGRVRPTHVWSLMCSGNMTELCPSAVDPPQFSPTTATATPREGDQFMLPLSIDANPPPTIANITLDGALVNDTRFTVTATSLTIADVTRNDSGVYQITASNVAGSDSFTLTVDVYCECVCSMVCLLHHN